MTDIPVIFILTAPEDSNRHRLTYLWAASFHHASGKDPALSPSPYCQIVSCSLMYSQFITYFLSSLRLSSPAFNGCVPYYGKFAIFIIRQFSLRNMVPNRDAPSSDRNVQKRLLPSDYKRGIMFVMTV